MANYVFILCDRTNTSAKCTLAPRSVEDATIEEEVNGINHLRLSIPLDTADHRQRANQVQRFDVIQMINIDDADDRRSFRVYHYIQQKDRPLLTIEADDLILDLARVQFVLDGRTDIDYTHTGEGKYIASEASPTTVLIAALSRSNFTVGTISSALDAIPKEYQFQNETALSVLQKVVAAYQADFPNCGFRRNEDGTIDFLSDLAQNTSSLLINRKNLLNISKEVDVREYANRIFAWGAKTGWQHVHSGIESTITSFAAQTNINADALYVNETADAWKWHYGDVADLLSVPQAGSITGQVGSIAPGSSARTLIIGGISMAEYEYRGGVIEVTGGPLKGVLRYVDGNDNAGYIILNDVFRYDDSSELIGQSCRMSAKVQPVEILGFHVKTSFIESATTAILYDSAAQFGTNQRYRNGYCEFLDGNVVGLVTLINSHNNSSLFLPTLSVTPDSGVTYRVTANTPALGCLSTDEPIFPATPGDIILKRCIDFGGGLTIGKHPKWRSIVTSVPPSGVIVEDGSKFDVYQLCQMYTTQIGSLDKVRYITVQQFEINSIDGNILYPVSAFEFTSTKGDEVEAFTVGNSIEITSYGAWETILRKEDVVDPWFLYQEAQRYLSLIDEEKITYQIQCVDLYKADPQHYKFDIFEVGDKLSLFDEELQINVSDLHITKKIWKPLTPWVVELLEVNKLTTTLATQHVSELQNIKKSLDSIANQKRAETHDVCIYWDEDSKRCVRKNPPNSFCTSEQGNEDGKLRSDKVPINQSDCTQYAPAQAKNILPSWTALGALVTNVTNPAWNDTSRFAIDVDFKVSKTSYADVICVLDEATGSVITTSCDAADARIQIDDNGNVVPYNTAKNHGCYVQVRRKEGMPSSLSIYAIGWIVGFEM